MILVIDSLLGCSMLPQFASFSLKGPMRIHIYAREKPVSKTTRVLLSQNSFFSRQLGPLRVQTLIQSPLAPCRAGGCTWKAPTSMPRQHSPGDGLPLGSHKSSITFAIAPLPHRGPIKSRDPQLTHGLLPGLIEGQSTGVTARHYQRLGSSHLKRNTITIANFEFHCVFPSESFSVESLWLLKCQELKLL